MDPLLWTQSMDYPCGPPLIIENEFYQRSKQILGTSNEWNSGISERLKCNNFPGKHAPRPPPRGLCLSRLAVPPAQRWLLTLTNQPSTSKLSDDPGVVNRGCPWTGTPCFIYIFSLDFKRTLIRPIDAFHCCNSKTQTSQLTDWFIIKRLSI